MKDFKENNIENKVETSITFKDGDIISNNVCICIFNGIENDKYYGFYIALGNIDCPNILIKHPNNYYFSKENTHFATEKEKQKLFTIIKEKGYKWNEEIRTLEKCLLKPKFKVGDKIRKINSNKEYQIVYVGNSVYHYFIKEQYGKRIVGSIKMIYQDEYELV